MTLLQAIRSYLASLNRTNPGPSLRRVWRYWLAARRDGMSLRKRTHVALCMGTLVDCAEKLVRLAQAQQAGQVDPPAITWTAPGGQA